LAASLKSCNETLALRPPVSSSEAAIAAGATGPPPPFSIAVAADDIAVSFPALTFPLDSLDVRSYPGSADDVDGSIAAGTVAAIKVPRRELIRRRLSDPCTSTPSCSPSPSPPLSSLSLSLPVPTSAFEISTPAITGEPLPYSYPLHPLSGLLLLAMAMLMGAGFLLLLLLPVVVALALASELADGLP
jgi:hypothetical protein